MAEVIGVISSVLTIAYALNGAIDQAKTFYRAQEEFEVLQEQLLTFSNLIKEIESQHTASSSTIVATNLAKAKNTIEHLDSLVRVKILKNANGTSRARRRAWARNKPRLLKMQTALKEHKEILSDALSVSNIAGTNRIEATLMTISHKISSSKETSSSLHQELSQLQQSCSEIQHAVSFQNDAVQRISNSLQALCKSHPHSLERNCAFPSRCYNGLQESALERSNLRGHCAMDPDKGLHMLGNHGESSQSREAHDIITKTARIAPASGPASPFETSTTFFPEIYTTERQSSNVSFLVTRSQEHLLSVHFRTNLYGILYEASPRQWRRLTLLLDVPRSSTYWSLTKLSQHKNNTVVVCSSELATLPGTLITQIRTLLLNAEEIYDDVRLRISLSSENVLQLQYQGPQIFCDQSANASFCETQEILTSLDDLGCPRYLERHVEQIELFEPPNIFRSSVAGTDVYEIKFCGSIPSSESIQLLSCMKGVSGFPRLMGVVVDTTGKYLKSYLVKFPRVKCDLVPHKTTINRFVPWHRIERWAKELLHGTSQAHSKGFAIGTLCSQKMLPLVDSSDSILFWRFKARFKLGYRHGCYYPPEYKHLRDASNSDMHAGNAPRLTAKTDIFHLGMILWLLAEELPLAERASPICFRQRCGLWGTQSCCDESHIEPIALPPLPESIPQYYRQVVESCRAKDPNQRPAAWRLLELFPVTHGAERSQTQKSNPTNLDLLSLYRSIGDKTFCEVCWQPTDADYFHCNICLMGEFDICPTCFDKGAHCQNEDHILVEMNTARTWNVAGKYHSSRKSDGTRDVIDA